MSTLVCDACRKPFKPTDTVLEVTKAVEATAMSAAGTRQYVTGRYNVHDYCMSQRYSNPTPIKNPAAE